MKIRIDGRDVDVLDRNCAKRPCYSFGFDKGSFTQGRGYTNYHTDAKGRRVERPVCMTRHLRGCPMNSLCPDCRRVHVDPPGATCGGCGGVTVADDAALEPAP